ncbi:germination protein YpeB [Mahella sp.]|uniref:germination protein YpeB n=1 Tax=Mahella sp. TaxID=2798721 RepID=UPI0025BED708|nr:germination protein YpeB [Mahella sp.]MBZ4666826.1 germination protein YpeB [Mahella sp.]
MKRRHWILPMILATALAVVSLWGYDQYRQKQQYNIYMENIYEKSFYNLVSYTQSIEGNMSKLMATATPAQYSLILTDIWRQAESAGDSLGQLPISHIALDNTAKFLNQIGDFSYYLARNATKGKPISAEEWRKLEELHNYSADMKSQLLALEQDVSANHISWSEIMQKGGRTLNNQEAPTVDSHFEDIEKTMMDYPSLIYDGPFSESVERREPLGLTDKSVSYEQAQKIAENFIGKDVIASIKKIGEDKGTIPTWNMEVTPKNASRPHIYINISKKGGEVVWMTSSATAPKQNLTVQQATDRASAFLEEKGYKDMTVTYAQHYNGIAIINFAYKQDNVIVYPDLIKVKVSMGDGNIVGFEGTGYLMSHTQRKLDKPSLTEQEAREFVSDRLSIKSARLAVIPTPAKNEVLTYEFKAEFAGEQYLVYINALNGNEENILKILTTNNGVLTI